MSIGACAAPPELPAREARDEVPPPPPPPSPSPFDQDNK
jgi:hypothetical protein